MYVGPPYMFRHFRGFSQASTLPPVPSDPMQLPELPPVSSDPSLNPNPVETGLLSTMTGFEKVAWLIFGGFIVWGLVKATMKPQRYVYAGRRQIEKF